MLLWDKIGEGDTHDVMQAIMDLSAKFRAFGRALGLRPTTLDMFHNNHPHDSGAALGQVIDAWLAQQYDTERFGKPSWRNLVSAVESPAGGHNPVLALQIIENHPGKQLIMTTVYVHS